ncbi:ABC transporter permease [Orrella sp. 11846]|uniref:ABC transporter permease n=1 Tax=Orrella sp. 11846 TaxID=3409913 RepID=UPI003B5B7DA3
MWIETNIAFKFLRQGMTQTLLILIGVAIGVCVIVFITTLVNGLQENLIERTLGTQAHIRIESEPLVNRIAPPSQANEARLIQEDIRAQKLRSIDNWQQVIQALETLPGITAVSPVVSGPGFARRADAVKAISLIGVMPERYLRIIKVDQSMIAGQFEINPGDAVIGTKLAQDLGVRVGSKMRIETSQDLSAIVTITGIFDLGVRELDSRFVYMDMKQVQTLLNLPGAATVIDLSIHELLAATDMAHDIIRLTGLQAESWMEMNSQLMNALQSQDLSSRLISFFVAISVAFGIASVLAISVTQRTREIGILRAMGIHRQQILWVFLLQGALVGLIGSAIGAMAGWSLVWAFNHFGPKFFDIEPSLTIIPFATVLATLTGMLAAIAPAWRASRLDPVKAIRYV